MFICEDMKPSVSRVKFNKESRGGKNMSIKFSETPCKKSDKGRPCIIKFVKTSFTGDGNRTVISRCRRCKEITTETQDATKLECPISPNGKHQWKWKETLEFRQLKRYQEKTDKEECPHCKAQQIREYQTMIPYNPHKRR
jgi:RNA polymerase subunit RPABC4/transcription elongation factor Spt4